jgi:hypothetical protein
LTHISVFRRAIIMAVVLLLLVVALGISGVLPDSMGGSFFAGGTRGKSTSVPDSDGTGADKGEPGPDKPPTGDGNNGCGNDADGEDDNNGNCFGVVRASYARTSKK